MNNTITMQELFNGRIFEVPDYQRSYSWETKQVRDFLKDIHFISSNRRHYTGTVVLDPIRDGARPTDKLGQSYGRFHIVDGQQRLTTTALFFNAISRAIKSFAPSMNVLADGIHQNYVATVGLNGRPLPKLSLNSDTNDFFQGLVSDGAPPLRAGPAVSAQRRLRRASKQINKHLDMLCEENHNPGQLLQDLYLKVTNQMHFTLYETEDPEEVGIIFEVMNDRGKPLTELEKVKNFLIYASTRLDVPNDLREDVNRAWSMILRTLMGAKLESSDDEDLFLRSDWRCRYNPRPKDWKGIESIKRRFELRVDPDQHNELLGHLADYTTGSADSCVAYADAVNPNRDDAFESFIGQPKLLAEVKRWNSKLVRINVLQPIAPILMAVRERWLEDASKYLQVLRLCERFSFRVYEVKDSRSDAAQQKLFSLAHRISQRQIDFEGIKTEIREIMRQRCDESEFQRSLAQLKAEADWYEWDGLKYMLYEYETHLAQLNGQTPEYAWEAVTIEHVLPQKTADNEYWNRWFDQEQHKRYLNDIGNLTLTLSNSSYGNKDFHAKKGSVNDPTLRCYANSKLYCERDLTRWDDWTPESIEKRGLEIMAWARDRWADES